MTARRTVRLALPLVLGLAGLAACSSADDTSTIGSTRPPGRIQPGGGGGGGGPRVQVSPFVEFDTCDTMVEWAREQMLERVTAYGLDRSYPWIMMREGDVGVMPAMTEAASATTAAAADASGPALESSTASTGGGTSATNTHTEGVDEGDIAETDGRFVYTIADGALRSIDLDTATVVSTLSTPGFATDMILNGDRLLVAGTDWSAGSGETTVATYAIADGVLTSLGSTHLEGSLVAVRSVDGTARLVLNQPFGSKLPFVQPRDGGRRAEDEALERNREVIESATAEQLIPRRYSEGPNGGSGDLQPALDCAQVGHPAEFSGLSTVWIASVDLTGADAGVTGSAGVDCRCTDRVLVQGPPVHRHHDVPRHDVRRRPGQPGAGEHVDPLLQPRRDDGADYEASGTVEGTVINQYALSEFEGSLRVATTTTAGGFGDSTESGVHVLQLQGDAWAEVGSIGGLGRGETIQGVRFVDDRGYVVTFRQTDPLYVLDLSDPVNPRLDGELKIPGFSTYLHPIGGGRLLAIGMAGTESGQITGTQLSLFDVNDPANPTLVDTLDLGAWGSEAAYDPHAFLFWAESGTVVVPVDSGECWYGGLDRRGRRRPAGSVSRDLRRRRRRQRGRRRDRRGRPPAGHRADPPLDGGRRPPRHPRRHRRRGLRPDDPHPPRQHPPLLTAHPFWAAIAPPEGPDRCPELRMVC